MSEPTVLTDTWINYTEHLNDTFWPSSSTSRSDGSPQMLDATALPPPHAASALGRLVRWSHVTSALFEHDMGGREELVRHSRLGEALAARALHLSNPGELYALYRDEEDSSTPRAAPAELKDVLDDVLGTLIETHPVANMADLARVAAQITGSLHARYICIPR